MDTLITAILAAAPYMGPILYLVWRQQQRIDLLENRQQRMIDRQQRMIDWFMEHSEMSAQQAEEIRGDGNV